MVVGDLGAGPVFATGLLPVVLGTIFAGLDFLPFITTTMTITITITITITTTTMMMTIIVERAGPFVVWMLEGVTST